MADEKLPTARLARAVNAVVAHGEELHTFARSLMDRREVDPADPAVASAMGSLYARLREVVKDAQDARDLASFYVKAGREKAASDREVAEERHIADRIAESA